MAQPDPSIDPRILYRMEPRPLGRGGYAEVMAATSRADGSKVALKRCNSSNDARARLHREINAQRDLVHPNIMPIWDSDPGYQWYTMPRADGTLTANRANLEEDEFTSLIEEISWALEVAHRQHHIHRDVSPNNILTIQLPESQGPRWVVSDWGLVLRPPTSSSPPLTVSGQGLGTPGFSAPELMLNAKYETSPRVDIYSLGRVAEWYLSGKWPVPGVSNLPEGDSQHWRQFIRICTAPRPEDRPESMQALRSLLAQVFESKGHSASSRAGALMSGVVAGDDRDLQSLIDLAIGYPDDASLYLDYLTLVSSTKLRQCAELAPKQASDLAQKMAWHIINSWEGRDNAYVEASLGFVFTILQTLIKINEHGHGEDVALPYFSADAHTNHERQRDRTLEWLAELEGAAAMLIHRALTPQKALVSYYARPRSWQARSSLLTALLAM